MLVDNEERVPERTEYVFEGAETFVEDISDSRVKQGVQFVGYQERGREGI